MKLTVKINSLGNCKLAIQDISNYLPESSNYTSEWNQPLKKSDTSSLLLAVVENVLKESIEVKQISYNSNISIDFDGNFKLYYLVLPTRKCIYNNIKLLDNYNHDFIYYIHENKVWKYKGDIQNDVIISDLIQLIETVSLPNIRSTISSVNKEQVSICSLQKCYVNLCQQIFEHKAFSQCFNKNDIDKELIYKRDLVWMAINVIDYLARCGQFEEANRYIKLLNGCNGVCGDKKITTNGNGCGCS